MASGLLALLDDVAAIAKVAAASLDDTAAAAAKASAKAAGVVIDDAAVTPQYVTGFSPARELPIVAKIARGSLRNKLVLLLPGALLLSAFAPWAITPLLMAGGGYLCFEGAEKLYESVQPQAADGSPPLAADAAALEAAMVAGAIRTDLILSGEIMAISHASVADTSLVRQALALVVVAVMITALVYGAVALIVKADDAGLALARSRRAVVRGFGRGLVAAMPPLLAGLAGVGTAAMLWVGGGIIVHGLESFGVAAPAHLLHDAGMAAAATAGMLAPVAEWLVGAVGSALFGLAIGAVIVIALQLRGGPRH